MRRRIVKYLNYRGISKYKFYQDTGLSNGYLDKDADLNSSSYEKISSQYKDLNMEWVRTGEGEMLKSPSSGEEKAPIESSRLVPLLPLTAQGGSLLNFADSVRIEDCEQIRSPINDVDFAIAVRGDSMAPEYPNGSQVLIKKINERAFIEWGRTYVLDTCNGSVIKTLVPSEKEGMVRCLSINPSPQYAPFDVSWEDVYGVYRVLMCMSLK